MTSETTKRVQLSRALILETALRLATDEPKRKLTTTRLGKELGADPTAVYRHFRNRDELVMAVADQVVKEVLDSYEPAGAWRESLTQFLLTDSERLPASPRPGDRDDQSISRRRERAQAVRAQCGVAR